MAINKRHNVSLGATFLLGMVLLLSSCSQQELPNDGLAENNSRNSNWIDTSTKFTKAKGLLSLDEFNIICIKSAEFANLSSYSNKIIEIDEADSILIRETDTNLRNVKGFMFPTNWTSGDSDKTVCKKFFKDYDELGFEATKGIDCKTYHVNVLDKYS